MRTLEEAERRCDTIYNPKTKTWSGLKVTPVYGPQYSVGTAVLEALQRNPEHISQICHHNGKVYTNGDIATLSIRIAQHFRKLQIPQCEIVGIVSGNTDYLAPLFFGSLLCGLTICPLEPGLDKAIMKQAYSITRPSIVFTAGSAYYKIKECFEELNLEALIYTMNDHKRGVPEISEFIQETIDGTNLKLEQLKYGYEQTAAILRSSGTTGTPKTICLSHASLLNAYSPKMEPDEIFLRSSTIYWVSGLCRLVITCLFGITSVINETGFKATMMEEFMKKYKITYIYSAPRLLAEVLQLPNVDKIDFSSLRKFHTGGCGVPHALIEKAKVFMPTTQFHIVYGSSEICGTVSNGVCHPNNNVGKLVPNFELKIIDENGNKLGVGEIGEICTKSVFPWRGYYKNPQVTAKVYKDGWIHSGDLGYVDEQGFIFVADRKNDVIKYKDHVIYPNEIESIIAEIPGVADVSVCGVPDEKAGQLVAAGVTKTSGSKLTAAEIYEYVSKRVDDYKNLRGGVYFTVFLPKTLTGKNLRFRVGNFCETQRRISMRQLIKKSEK